MPNYINQDYVKGLITSLRHGDMEVFNTRETRRYDPIVSPSLISEIVSTRPYLLVHYEFGKCTVYNLGFIPEMEFDDCIYIGKKKFACAIGGRLNIYSTLADLARKHIYLSDDFKIYYLERRVTELEAEVAALRGGGVKYWGAFWENDPVDSPNPETAFGSTVARVSQDPIDSLHHDMAFIADWEI